MSFEFKTIQPEISDKAKELAQKYGYRPYMIERYFSMFKSNLEEVREFLDANEQFSPLTLRINTLKTDPQAAFEALISKGYRLKPSEHIPYAYSIEHDVINEKTAYTKPKSPEYEMQGFERDPTTLKNIEWGRPSYLDENGKAESEKRDETKSTHILRGKQIATLGSTHEYLLGHYYIQDLASMYPVFYLNPQKTNFVLDMAAAPGGKTSHLAQIMENQGHIFAMDNNKKRIKSLVYNLRRCGVNNTTVLLMDANSSYKQSFNPDKILLDAPCTGEGLIRDDPSRKTSKTLSEITGMMRKQYSMLQSAIKTVKSGGEIMYSTCSIAPEENEFVVQKALDSHSNIEIASIDDDWGLPGYINVFGMDLSEDLLKARRLFPHIHNTIGFFYCLLRKI
ncbi:MAG: RsmB/NOP family class I SAM-dependent RNA methyltransferase [Promethearchaeota archaeon]|nr:MAG: RsmB/NOP family class I SAM-dependent RNA methyltransferase [Candidatus Lokiarchaeota archaeon]